MSEVKRISLVKPTLQTHFHIDFNWWSQRDRDWRVHLQGLLCSEHQQAFSDFSSEDRVDFVDPNTAEVQQVDGVQHILITHCARQEGFITQHTTLVDAIFRTFVANGNEPMTPVELGERLNRPAQTILRVLSSGQVYRGMRPIGKV
ncbi:MAG: hypothetical protein EHM41_14675 [Chloroflexi bacterium]|nr:MAG: hypothetical protein EHM41_14675 [Chloroflexota bacterium]